MRQLALQGPVEVRHPRELDTERKQQGRDTPQRTAPLIHHGAISPSVHVRAEELHRRDAGSVGAAVGAEGAGTLCVAEAAFQIPTWFGDRANAGGLCKFGARGSGYVRFIFVVPVLVVMILMFTDIQILNFRLV